jgi:hypothetical protein
MRTELEAVDVSEAHDLEVDALLGARLRSDVAPKFASAARDAGGGPVGEAHDATSRNSDAGACGRNSRRQPSHTRQLGVSHTAGRPHSVCTKRGPEWRTVQFGDELPRTCAWPGAYATSGHAGGKLSRFWTLVFLGAAFEI